MKKNIKIKHKKIEVKDIDDEMKDISSFDEARAIIETRLNHLHSDLFIRTKAEEALLNNILKSEDEIKTALMDVYAGYYSPCKVTDTVFVPKGDGDMNDMMIDFSEGYDDFVRDMQVAYAEKLDRKRKAAQLVKNILSLKYPYSRVLYLSYYQLKDPDDVADMLYFSRATFYRSKSLGINMLTKIYYPHLGNGDDGDDGTCKKAAGKGDKPIKPKKKRGCKVKGAAMAAAR